MFYVFDACEMIMGPYDTFEQAEYELDLFVTECYLLDQFPSPYVDYMEDYDEELDFAKRERIIKRRNKDA